MHCLHVVVVGYFLDFHLQTVMNLWLGEHYPVHFYPHDSLSGNHVYLMKSHVLHHFSFPFPKVSIGVPEVSFEAVPCLIYTWFLLSRSLFRFNIFCVIYHLEAKLDELA